MSVTSQSAVFDLHEKTREFETSYNENLYAKMYPALTGMIYMKAIPERFLGDPTQPFAFDKQLTNLEIRELANQFAYDEMRNVYGTTPGDTNAREVSGGCLAVFYASRLGSPVGADVAPPDTICTAIYQEGLESDNFPRGESITANFEEMKNERAQNPKGGAKPPFDDGNYSDTTRDLRDEVESVDGTDLESRLENESEFTLDRDTITRIAFQNVTGRPYSPKQGDADRIAEVQQNINASEEFGGESIDQPTDQPWRGGSFSDEVRDVINDTYTVASAVEEVHLAEGSLNESSDKRVVETGDFSVEKQPDGADGSVLVRLPVRIEEDGNWTKRVVFNATISATGNYNYNTTIKERGIKYPVSPPAYVETSQYPTFIGGLWGSTFEASVTGDDNANESEIEGYLEDTVNTSVTTTGEFESALAEGVNSEGTKLAHEPEMASRSAFQNWLIGELQDTVNESNNVTVERNMTTYLDNDQPTFRKLKINESERSTLVYDSTLNDGQYETPAERSLAELRNRWVNTTNWYLEKAAQRKQNRVDMLEEKLNDGPGPDEIDEAYEQGIDNASSWDDSLYNDSRGPDSSSPYQINVEPAWMGYFPETGDNMQFSNPRDEVREDTENVRFTAMANREVFMLPTPGMPIIPLPGFWYVSANNYYAHSKGEYARFQVKPRAPENHIANTSYVKQPGPVSLEFNGLRRPVGRVTPIDYSMHYEMPVLMVGKTPVQDGNWGIGDYIFSNLNPFIDCTPTFPKTGTGSHDEDRHNTECGSAGTIGETVGAVLSIGAGSFGGGKLTRNLKRHEHMKATRRQDEAIARNRGFNDEIRRLQREIDEIDGQLGALDRQNPRSLARRSDPSHYRPAGDVHTRLRARQADQRRDLTARREQLEDQMYDYNGIHARIEHSQAGRYRDVRRERRDNFNRQYEYNTLGHPRYHKDLTQNTRIKVIRNGWDDIPENDRPELSSDFKRWRKVSKTGIVQGTERAVDHGVAMALRDGSYDRVECPRNAYKDRDDYTTGCDDDQLEVEVYPADDGTVVSIESEIQEELGDRTLHFQTRPDVPGPEDERLLLGGNDDIVYDNIDYSAKQDTVTFPMPQSVGSYQDTEFQTNYSVYLNQTADGDYAFQNKTGVVKPASGAQEAALADTNITVVEPQVAGNAPMLRVVYDGYTFLIALMEGEDVDWERYRDALSAGPFDPDAVNVFIGSTQAQKELSSEVSPRSSVVVDEGGVSPDHDCVGDPMSVYYGDETGERIKFRVDESDRLFGPEDEPNEFC
ncbi:hypothetical protein ACFQER_07055 [Halomicroarcula sp. GCM10025894]